MGDSTAGKPKTNLVIRILQIAFLGLLSFYALNALKGCQQPQEASQAVMATASWAPPSMYALASTQEGVSYGYRWLPKEEYECGLFQTCAGVEIVTSKDCPNGFSLQAILLDQSGANIGTVANAANLVTANQRTKIVVAIKGAAVTQARIAQTSCH